jgi:hypothetical protein
MTQSSSNEHPAQARLRDAVRAYGVMAGGRRVKGYKQLPKLAHTPTRRRRARTIRRRRHSLNI